MSNVTNSMQATSEEILNDIQNLQQTEQGLFNSLETNVNLTPEQQQQIMQNINQITNMRVSLYQALSNVNGFFQDALKTSHGTLEDQAVAISIVEEELNRMKQSLKTLQTEKTNKLRIVEINNYYGDKYAEHSQLMKIIIFTLVPIIILTVLKRNDILPTTVYYVLLAIVTAIGAYFFWKRLASILSRDSIYYDEYNWYFDPSTAPSPSGKTTDPWLNQNIDLGTCVGSMCCSKGQTYDASLNQCVGDSTVVVPSMSQAHSSSQSSSSAAVESFVNQVLSKDSSTNNYKYYNKFSNPKPSNSSSFAFYKGF
jgi:hypothetical protein